MKRLLIVYCLVFPVYIFANSNDANANKEGYASVSGYVKDEKGEELIGANVFITSESMGTTTNVYGFYSLTLPIGKYEISYSFIGYETLNKTVLLDANQSMNIKLNPDTKSIEEVEISAESKDRNVTDVAMSNVKLQTKEIRKIPVIFGEMDVIKTIQLLPGVQTMGEGNSGFYVRGGSVDQNLILLDEATVYNPTHIGGIFSLFNGDALKDVQLIKGGINSNYGGRLASVLDVRMKEGNMSEIHGSGGLGLISGRLTLEGPIVKNKVSFILAGRRTWADLWFPVFNNEGLDNSRMFFYDLNGKVNWVINENNRIFISSYFGRDVYKFDDLFEMKYGNVTVTARWNHVYNNRIFSNVTLLHSNFDYKLGQPSGAFGFVWNANVIDNSIKNEYTYYFNPNNTINFGFQSIYHTIKPGEGRATSESNFNNLPELPYSYGLENAIFIQNEQKLTEKLSVNYGLRYSNLVNVGKSTVYKFVEDEEGKLVVDDSASYPAGKFFNPKNGWEPRFSARYTLNSKSSVKASYDRMYQYIHLATNTTTPTPLDMWFLSNPNINPQYSDQVALGYFRNFKDNSIETSVEVYYKKLHNTIDFVDHAEILLNRYFDGELREGDGKSYGAEFLVRKQQGRFTGWFSYTYSKTLRKIDGINGGKEYNSPYDRPHDIKIVASYDINKKYSISANWVYSSPLPYTVAVSAYRYDSLHLPIYSDRNEVRLKGTAFHRLDLAFTINFRDRGTYKHSMQISIYNVYNRHNLYSIIYEQPVNKGDGVLEMKKLYLYPIIPTLTYNLKF